MVEFSDLFDNEEDVFQKKAKVGTLNILRAPSSFPFGDTPNTAQKHSLLCKVLRWMQVSSEIALC